jgi:hypothetical protein
VRLHLINLVTAIFLAKKCQRKPSRDDRLRAHLQIPLDITEEWDVAYTRNYEQEKGAGEDEDGEEGRDCECGCDQIVPNEIFLEVVPRCTVLFRQIDGKQSQGVDNLTRTISEKQTLPTYSRV